MTGALDVLGVISARGGSKGLPRKNVLPLAGRPLIAWSIAAARESATVARTIVSTDDEEIARVAREHGAEVPFMRPAQFAQDGSLDFDVFRHALEWLRDRDGYSPELVVHLRATGPVRRVERIDTAIEKMLEHPEADSLRSVGMPIQTPYTMWRIVNGRLEPLLRLPGVAEAHSSPRQGLPPVYWQNGYVDILRPRVVLEKGMMAGDHVLPFVVDEPILELDYPESIPAIEAALDALARGDWPPASQAPEVRHPV